MFTFKIDGCNALGDYDKKFGQAYWCTSPDVDLPIKFNLRVEGLDERLAEQGPFHIAAEEKAIKQSRVYTDDEGNQKGGNEYIQLKKVKLLERDGAAKPETASSTQGATQPAAAHNPNLQTAPHVVQSHHEDMSGKADQVMKALRLIYKRQETILSILRDGTDPEAETPPTEPENSPPRDWNKLGKKDEVHMPVDGQEVSLDEVPDELL